MGMSSKARELALFIDNDRELYSRQKLPIIKNLMRKHASGQYDRNKAVKLFMYLVVAAAKKYAGEHGSSPWNKMFAKADRAAVAKSLRDDFEDEAQFGNYDEYIPKKYKGVSGRTLGEAHAVFTPEERSHLHDCAEQYSDWS